VFSYEGSSQGNLTFLQTILIWEPSGFLAGAFNYLITEQTQKPSVGITSGVPVVCFYPTFINSKVSEKGES
jgi:hypothetical protein